MTPNAVVCSFSSRVRSASISRRRLVTHDRSLLRSNADASVSILYRRFSGSQQDLRAPSAAVIETSADSFAKGKAEGGVPISKIWTVTVRDRLMIARPFSDQLNPVEHEQSSYPESRTSPTAAGSTLLADATFIGNELVSDANFLVDIGLALTSLNRVLGKYAYQDIGKILQQRSVSMECFAQRLWTDMLDTLQKATVVPLPIDRMQISLREPGTGHSVAFESTIGGSASDANVGSVTVSVDDTDSLIPRVDPISVRFTSDWNKDVSIDLRRLDDIVRSESCVSHGEPMFLLQNLWHSIAQQIEKVRVPTVGDQLRVARGPFALHGSQGSNRIISLSHYRALRVTHSFRGDCFGPAQGLHGTSFAVETKLEIPCISALGVDCVTRLRSLLEAASESVLEKFDSINLDHHPDFKGCNTTCEYLAEYFANEVGQILQESASIQLPEKTHMSAALVISIKESDVAGVSFQRDLRMRTSAEGMIAPVVERDRSSFSSTLIFDLDNCLFHDAEVHGRLVSRIHEICESRYEISKDECDRLHSHYGSTIEGLVKEMPSTFTSRFSAGGLHTELRVLYEQIYTDPSLFYSSTPKASSCQKTHQSLVDLICSLPNSLKIICSNSHSVYVERALESMGFSSGSNAFDYIITPDIMPGLPNKVDPRFWEYVCEKLKAQQSLQMAEDKILFFDDCPRNLAAAEHYFCNSSPGFRLDAVRVNPNAGSKGFKKALIESLIGVPLQIDRIAYLRGIAKLNQESLSQHILQRLERELAQSIHAKQIAVLDIGCGLCPMLPLVSGLVKRIALSEDPKIVPELTYVGLELESNVRTAAVEDLQRLYRLDLHNDDTCNKSSALSRLHGNVNGVRTNIILLEGDVMKMKSPEDITSLMHCDGIDLVVASCFVDLFPPTLLATQLSRLAPGALLWAPLCCSDNMRFEGEQLQSEIASVAMESYIKYLKECQQQHLSLSAMREDFSQVGVRFLADSSIECHSDWRVSSKEHPEVYNALVKFLAMGVIPDLLRQKKLDAACWVLNLMKNAAATNSRAEKLPAIFTHNIDVIAVLPNASEGSTMAKTVQSLVFSGKRSVNIVDQDLRDNSSLEQVDEFHPDTIEVESLYSAVSPGTELRLFENKFGDKEEIDEVFSPNAFFGYPMSYGYQTVGVVKRMGSGVPLDLAGKVVFGFLPHRSRHLVDDFRSVIPIDTSHVDPRNFCFLPALETALNIVHDSEVKIGDKVCVMGQGLIGNITTAVLLLSGVEVTAFDIIDSRLHASQKFALSLGASFSDNFHAGSLSRNSDGLCRQFDTAIELSGTSAGLQSCLEYTRFGGRVVVGSWGSANKGDDCDALSLHLDTKFHRSKIQIVSSQVSKIAGKFSDTWDKERRLQKAVDLVRKIRPYDVLISIPNFGVAEMSVSSAQAGYEMLSDRKVSAVVFNYDKNDSERRLERKSARAGSIVSSSAAIEDHYVDLGKKKSLEFLSKSRLATRFGDFDVQVWRYDFPKSWYASFKGMISRSNDCPPLLVLMTRGIIGPQTRRLTLRLHDACITSEAFGSVMCDCQQQMLMAQKQLSQLQSSPDNGAMILYTFQEGRGIGLPAKIAAYNLQREHGLDTLDANLALGCPADARDYSFLKELFFAKNNGLAMNQEKLEVELLSNNPRKAKKLRENGVNVAKMVSLVSDETVSTCKETGNKEILTDCHAGRYLDAKVKRMGHKIDSKSATTRLTSADTQKQNCHDRNQPLSDDLQPLLPLLEVWSTKFKEHVRKREAAPHRKPFVTLSYASGLDGCIGNNSKASSDRLMISGPQSNVLTHALRCGHDAILVGVGTVLADNPKLSARLVEAVKSAGNSHDEQVILDELDRLDVIPRRSEWKSPTPVIIDSSLRTPLDCRLILNATELRPVIIVTSAKADAERIANLRAQAGVEVLIIEAKEGKLCLDECFQILGEKYRFSSIMVEGGASIIKDLLSNRATLVDLHVLTMAPRYFHKLETHRQNTSESGRVHASGNVRLFPLHPAAQFGDDVVLMSSVSCEHRTTTSQVA